MKRTILGSILSIVLIIGTGIAAPASGAANPCKGATYRANITLPIIGNVNGCAVATKTRSIKTSALDSYFANNPTNSKAPATCKVSRSRTVEVRAGVSYETGTTVEVGVRKFLVAAAQAKWGVSLGVAAQRSISSGIEVTYTIPKKTKLRCDVIAEMQRVTYKVHYRKGTGAWKSMTLNAVLPQSIGINPVYLPL